MNYRGSQIAFILSLFFLLNLIACAGTPSHGHGPVNVSSDSTSPVLGEVAAPVKIVEFTDFECPYCAQVQPALMQVMQTYPKEVSLTFKNFPLAMHRHAHVAHLAAMCAHEQGKFWEFRNILFQNQRALKRSDLNSYAQRVGLDMNVFGSCVDQEKYGSKIEEDYREGMASGVLGTPAFLIGSELASGALSFEAFDAKIKELLAKKAKQGN